MFTESIKHISEVVFGKTAYHMIPKKGIYSQSAINGKCVTDQDLIKFTLNHMSVFDKFNPSKIIVASLFACDMMLDFEQLPKKSNWKFKFY